LAPPFSDLALQGLLACSLSLLFDHFLLIAASKQSTSLCFSPTKGTTNPSAIFSLYPGCYNFSQSSKQTASIRLVAGAIVHQNGLHPEHRHRFTLGTIPLFAPIRPIR
jgi:hypothetical protein